MSFLMSNVICHPYHIVDESPWPFYGSLGGLFLTSGILSWFHLQDITLFIIGLAVLSLVIVIAPAKTGNESNNRTAVLK